MRHRFKKHYTRDEARALLPTIRKWLGQLQQIRRWLVDADGELEKLLEEDPFHFRFQQELAKTYRLVGGELGGERKYDEALQILEKGQAIVERLARAETQVGETRVCTRAFGGAHVRRRGRDGLRGHSSNRSGLGSSSRQPAV